MLILWILGFSILGSIGAIAGIVLFFILEKRVIWRHVRPLCGQPSVLSPTDCGTQERATESAGRAKYLGTILPPEARNSRALFFACVLEAPVTGLPTVTPTITTCRLVAKRRYSFSAYACEQPPEPLPGTDIARTTIVAPAAVDGGEKDLMQPARLSQCSDQ